MKIDTLYLEVVCKSLAIIREVGGVVGVGLSDICECEVILHKFQRYRLC